MSKIKPCPFCGFKAKSIKYCGTNEVTGNETILYMVKCTAFACEAQVDGFVLRGKAIMVWNKRVENKDD